MNTETSADGKASTSTASLHGTAIVGHGTPTHDVGILQLPWYYGQRHDVPVAYVGTIFGDLGRGPRRHVMSRQRPTRAEPPYVEASEVSMIHHIDRNWLLERDAGREAIDSFEASFPSGLDYDPHTHECAARIAASPWSRWLGWAISYGLQPQRLEAGNCGSATAGDRGAVTVGHNGRATVGDRGTATAGHYGSATAGFMGSATAGFMGTATAGEGGTAVAGDYGSATAGRYGSATADRFGTATADHFGTVSAGDGGILQCRWHDGQRYRIAVAYVGEDGILPDTPYRIEDGRWVRA